jgi:succinyl-CoA synthetase beta subunit
MPALRVPIVARIIGNGFEEARDILARSGLPVTVEPDLDRALALTARLAGG